MQHVNRIGKGRDVDHTKGARRISHSKFSDPRSYARHRFPIARFFPALDPVKLIAKIRLNAFWKLAQTGARIAEKTARFILYLF